MARAKKAPAVETVSAEAVEDALVINRAEFARQIAEIEYEAAKLGHIGHLYYAKKVGERIAELSHTLKSLL